MYDLETRYKSVVHYNHFLRSLRKVSELSLRNDIHKCILDQIHNNPFITIEELTSIIDSNCNLKRSRRTINRYVKSCNLT